MPRPASRVLAAVATGSVVLLGAAAGPAGAATFGADLTPPTTGTVTCGSAFSTSSCLVSPVTDSFAPGSGVVNTVRVRTGPGPTGPMQVVVLRSYYQNNPADPGHPNVTCCGLQEYGPTFMPAPNTVNTVPVTLGMVEQPVAPPSDGNTVSIGDFLGLSVLSGTAVIPMNPNPANSIASSFNAPAPTPETLPAPSVAGVPGGRGAYGFTVMMNADITLLGAGGGGSAPTPTPTPAPVPGPAPAPAAAAKPVLLKQNGGRLTTRTASLPVVCKLTGTCAGTLTLRDRAPVATRAKATGKKQARKPVVLGTAKFSVAAGKTKTVKVKLNAAGRRLARRHGKQTVYETATVAKVPVTTKITLKR